MFFGNTYNYDREINDKDHFDLTLCPLSGLMRRSELFSQNPITESELIAARNRNAPLDLKRGLSA